MQAFPIGGGKLNQLMPDMATGAGWGGNTTGGYGGYNAGVDGPLDPAQGTYTLAQGSASYIGDGLQMLAQIADRIGQLEQPLKEVYQVWSNRSREVLSVEQLMQGLRQISLFCPAEVGAALVNAYDASGQGHLRFGDFNKMVNQGYMAHQMQCRGVVDPSGLSDQTRRFQDLIRNMRLAQPQGGMPGGFLGTQVTY